MLEARAFVNDLAAAKKTLEFKGAILKGEYRCRDLIYKSINREGLRYLANILSLEQFIEGPSVLEMRRLLSIS